MAFSTVFTAMKCDCGLPAVTRAATIEGREGMAGRVNFLIGERADWNTGIATYRRIVYRSLYPGIDASYACEQGIKSEFVVAPHADPSLIRLRYEDASSVSIDPNGDLVVDGSGAELREKAPVVYQDSPSGRKAH